MARRTAPQEKKARTDWYVTLTNETIQAMEAAMRDGREWSKMWIGRSGLPHNGLTGRQYHGLNVWLLILRPFSDPRWFTFDQAKQAVGYKKNPAWKGKADTYKGIAKWIWTGEGDDPHHGVRKGEKGTKVHYWVFIRKYEDRVTGKEVRRPTQAQINSNSVRLVETFPVLKVFTVFNAEQIEGLPVLDIPDVNPGEKYLQAEALLSILDVDLNHVPGSNAPCYRPGADQVALPAPGQFDNVEHYWATALHEVVHWTGHKNRLGRDLNLRFGSDAYAFEELVAELGSAFLCTHLGIEGDLRHPEYLASWIKRLRTDKYAIFKASSLAQKAVDFILAGGVVDEEKDDDTSDVDPEEASVESVVAKAA